MSSDLLPKRDQLLLKLLDDIVDKMQADIEDKDELNLGALRGPFIFCAYST
jgi:hypothetical protein